MALPPSIQPKTVVSLTKADIIAPPSYIEPSILTHGGQLILASRAKTGKSFMMLEMGRALASADRPFDSPEMFCPRSCRVLLIEQELGEMGLKKRVEKIYTPEEIRRQGFMADQFLYVSKVPELKLDTAKGCQLLYDLCEEVQPNVLMLDPLGRFHGYNENDNTEMGKLWGTLDELQKMFAHNGMALVVSAHMLKRQDIRAGFDNLDPYQIRGASKSFDNVDAVITTDRTHDLDTKGHKAWAVKCRFTLRHGESPDDMVLNFNEFNDSRVRQVVKGPLAQLQTPRQKQGPPAVQLGFNRA